MEKRSPSAGWGWSSAFPRAHEGVPAGPRLAGGARALTGSIEGAEDDPESGARAVQFRGVNKKDVVIGIAASGHTPFVWGAIEEASAREARTALVCFNPKIRRRSGVPRLIVAPTIGPEVLTGSTRLKAGTATKLILNSITTLAMVRLGKVASNLTVSYTHLTLPTKA